MCWGAACCGAGQALGPRDAAGTNQRMDGWAPSPEVGALQRPRVQTLHPESWKNPLPGWVATLMWLWSQAMGAMMGWRHSCRCERVSAYIRGSCGIPQSRGLPLTLDIAFHGKGSWAIASGLQRWEGGQRGCRGRDKAVLHPGAEALGTALHGPCCGHHRW